MQLASLDFKFIIVIQGINMEGALQKRSDVKVRGYVRRYIGTYTRIVYAGTWPRSRANVRQTERSHDPCHCPKLMKSRAAHPVPHAHPPTLITRPDIPFLALSYTSITFISHKNTKLPLNTSHPSRLWSGHLFSRHTRRDGFWPN